MIVSRAAIRSEATTALNAVFRFQSARLEIVSCVNHTAVAPTLMLCRTRLFFEHHDTYAGLGEMKRRACANRASANYHDVGVQLR